MQRNHTVNKANPGLLYNKQKLQLLPNNNELTTHIMGKETPLLINISPGLLHKAAKFKALFPVIMPDLINADANDLRELKLQFLSYVLAIIQCLRRQISDQTYRI